MSEVITGSQKVYTILFEGQKAGEFSFNTFNIRDIQNLLDSILSSYGKKKELSTLRIQMKSVKKIDKGR